MNIPLTEEVKQAITLIPVQEWKDLFEAARQSEYSTLVGTPDSELTTIKSRVMIINELEHLFTTARQQPIIPNNDNE